MTLKQFVFLAFLLGLIGCGGDSNSGPENSLSGKVTLDGVPVEFEMLMVSDGSGKEASSPRMPDGTYQIINPPKGKLKFKFAGGPPVPPGEGGPAAKKSGTIPSPYLSYQNDLSVEYTGGRQTYDLPLKK